MCWPVPLVARRPGRADCRYAGMPVYMFGDRIRSSGAVHRDCRAAHRAGFGFRDQAEAGLGGIRSGMSIGRDRAINQPRIQG